MIALCSFAPRSKMFDLLEPGGEEDLKFPLRSQSDGLLSMKKPPPPSLWISNCVPVPTGLMLLLHLAILFGLYVLLFLHHVSCLVFVAVLHMKYHHLSSVICVYVFVITVGGVAQRPYMASKHDVTSLCHPTRVNSMANNDWGISNF